MHFLPRIFNPTSKSMSLHLIIRSLRSPAVAQGLSATRRGLVVGPLCSVRFLATLMEREEDRIGTPAEPSSHSTERVLKDVARAQIAFAQLSQQDADRIFDAVAKASNQARLPLAKLAVQETGIGCFEDKVLKNGLASELIHDRYKNAKTCGLIESDPSHGKYTYASPAGPVCCITPITNPTSTPIAKALMMAKTRNAGLFLPHPMSWESTAEAVHICAEAGEAAGAPKGWIRCFPSPPTREECTQVMQSDEIRLILSTGGAGIVRASYRSGKPALGVGGGNAPVLVDETADLRMACGSIVMGKTFDNGVICAAEQSVVVVDEVYDEFKSLLEARGVFFLDQSDREKLSSIFYEDGHINMRIIGQTASTIAEVAALSAELPEGTVVLATEETVIGPENPLSAEKLSPVLSIYRVSDFRGALDICEALARNGGIGHTGAIYTEVTGKAPSKRTERFLDQVPVGRVMVNTPTSLSAMGTAFNFSVDPSSSLGVGTLAGSSISQNVGPMHLVNLTTVAERQKHMEWFNLPTRVFFNRGCLEEALQECAAVDENGRRDQRAIVVTDIGMVKCGHVDRLTTTLHRLGFQVEVFDGVHPDPDIECVRKGVQACDAFQPDIMFCLGGGSPMDAGKCIRVVYEHPELSIHDAATRFLEIRKRTVPFPKLGSKIHRLVTIPTTSGTGSEVSPFTVITAEDGLKHPIASYQLTPDMAICDSTLCDDLPKSLIANAGIDAVTHAVEAYVSIVQNDFTKQNALEALELIFRNLPESYAKGTAESRDAVHRGATLAGAAMSNSFLGICHSLAHQVGAKFHLPHGMSCAIFLPHVIRYNASDKPTKMGIYPSYLYPCAKERYSEISRVIGAPEETTESLIGEVQRLMKAIELPLSFKEAGVSWNDYMSKLDEMAEEAFDDQCTPTNPRFPLVDELKRILIAAYGKHIPKD